MQQQLMDPLLFEVETVENGWIVHVEHSHPCVTGPRLKNRLVFITPEDLGCGIAELIRNKGVAGDQCLGLMPVD